MGDMCNQIHKRDIKTKQLNDEQSTGITHFLLENKIGSKLKPGAIVQVARKFDVSRLTITRIWKRAKEQYRKANVCVNVASRKRNYSRKRKNYSKKLDKIKQIPLNRRGPIRSLSSVIDIFRSSVFHIFKKG